jgi:hypothetical protein
MPWRVYAAGLAGVVELADTPALGAGGASRGGSSPSARMTHAAQRTRIIRHAMAAEERDDVIIEHPNRDKASSKATKSIVILLLLASAGLMAIVAIGGWDALEGAKAILIAYIAVYVVMAYYTARWNRGVLPLAAAFGIILAIFAAIAGPQWFARDKTGFEDPALNESVLGLVTWLIVPVQVLLIAFAMRAFQQNWHVEVERPAHGGGYRADDDFGTAPARA